MYINKMYGTQEPFRQRATGRTQAVIAWGRGTVFRCVVARGTASDCLTL
jgi:hypothetical protein